MKPTLFIDFHGTLCHDKFLRTLDNNVHSKVEDFWLSQAEMIQNWMRGKFRSEDVILALGGHAHIPYNMLWKTFTNECKSMIVPGSALAKIQKIRNTHAVILVTDTMDSFTRFTVPALALNTYFDRIINSFDTGKLKNDEGGIIFKDYMNEYKVPPFECRLIDDSDKTCELFKQIGGRAFLVTKTATLEDHLDSMINI